MQNGHAFELLFEGPLDDRPETIRNLKAAFLVDMNLPMERVQEILSNTPTTVMTSDSKMEVEALLQLIKHAGGKVTLVQSIPDTNEPVDLTFDEEADSAEEVDIFEPGVKTYELNTAEDTDDLIPALLEKHTVGPAAQISENKLLLSDDLTLGDAIESSELHDSPVKTAISTEELLKEPDPVPTPQKVDEVEFVQQTSTAVEMVLQGLNSELSFAEAEDHTAVSTQPKKAEPSPAQKIPQMSAPVTGRTELTLELVDADTPEEAKASEKKVTQATQPSAQTAVSQEGPEDSAEISDSHLVNATEKNDSLNSETPKQDTLTKKDGAPTLSTTPKLAQAQKTVILPKQIAPTSSQNEKIAMSGWKSIALPISIGTALLMAGNWYYLHMENPKPSIQFDKALSSIAATQKQEIADTAAKEKKEVTKKVYFGEAVYEDRTISAEASLDVKSKKLFLTVKMQTPPPPALSAEEVGRRVRKAPWLRSVETEKFAVSVEENGSFHASIPGRVFVDDNGRSTRQLMTLQIDGTVNSDGTIQLESSLGQLEDSENVAVGQQQSGKYPVGIRGAVSLKTVADL